MLEMPGSGDGRDQAIRRQLICSGSCLALASTPRPFQTRSGMERTRSQATEPARLFPSYNAQETLW